MTRNTHTPDRRTVLRTLAAGSVITLAGCQELTDSEATTEPADGPISDVRVEETDLVVELDSDAAVDEVSVVDPSGELYAETAVAAGVSRETFPIEMPYDPGEYEIRALLDGDVGGTVTFDIRPDVRVVDLKLGRNHPEEMYEGAGDPATMSEAILEIENLGSGPAAVDSLRFVGDVPQETPDTYDQSGIYDTESDLHNDIEAVVLAPEAVNTLFSSTRPFSTSGTNVECQPEGYTGQFTVVLETASLGKSSWEYRITLNGEDLETCSIQISEVDA